MEFRAKVKRRFWRYTADFLIGVALAVISMLMPEKNETLRAFGIVLVIVGGISMIRNYRLLKDENLLNKKKIAENDERTHMISNRAKSITFMIYIYLALAAMLVLYLLEMNLAAQITAYGICSYVVIYLICYYILRRKY